MDINYLITFREVAKTLSFTRAGDILGYAQSSITTQIQKLEKEFGAQLFERYGRGIRLTSEGEQLLVYTESILSLWEEAKMKLASPEEMSGRMTFGTVESLAAFYLPPIMQRFRAQFPKMRLLLEPSVCTILREKIREGKLDFAIILDRYQEHDDIECVVLREEPMRLIAPTNHRLRDYNVVSPQDFSEETLIYTEEGCSYRVMFESVLKQAGVIPHSSLEFGSLEAIKQCVIHGLGLALLPHIAVKNELENGTLLALPFTHPTIQVHTQLIYHKKKWISEAMQTFFREIESG